MKKIGVAGLQRELIKKTIENTAPGCFEVFIYNDIIETDQKRIDGIICLHIRTVTALCRLFAEEMAAAGGGYILLLRQRLYLMPFPLRSAHRQCAR